MSKFEDILVKMREGQKATRDSWSDDKMISLQRSDIPEDKKLIHSLSEVMVQHPPVNGVYSRYIPSVSDALATDWRIAG